MKQLYLRARLRLYFCLGRALLRLADLAMDGANACMNRDLSTISTLQARRAYIARPDRAAEED